MKIAVRDGLHRINCHQLDMAENFDVLAACIFPSGCVLPVLFARYHANVDSSFRVDIHAGDRSGTLLSVDCDDGGRTDVVGNNHPDLQVLGYLASGHPLFEGRLYAEGELYSYRRISMTEPQIAELEKLLTSEATWLPKLRSEGSAPWQRKWRDAEDSFIDWAARPSETPPWIVHIPAEDRSRIEKFYLERHDDSDTSVSSGHCLPLLKNRKSF